MELVININVLFRFQYFPYTFIPTKVKRAIFINFFVLLFHSFLYTIYGKIKVDLLNGI
jgi:hypothetical protein